VVRAGQVTASVALPYAGLLSPLPATAMIAAVHAVEQAAWDLGCDALHPFLALASLADTSTGEVRITEQGLVDVLHQRLLPLQD
jgi:adenine deaminase